MELKILQWLSIGAAVIAFVISLASILVRKKLNIVLKQAQDEADRAASVQGDPMSIVISGQSAPKESSNETRSTQVHLSNPH
jgi:hypothetical protein